MLPDSTPPNGTVDWKHIPPFSIIPLLLGGVHRDRCVLSNSQQILKRTRFFNPTKETIKPGSREPLLTQAEEKLRQADEVICLLMEVYVHEVFYIIE